MLVSFSHLGSNSACSLKSVLTLAIGISFGFSFEYVLLSTVRWKKSDIFSSDQCNMSLQDKECNTTKDTHLQVNENNFTVYPSHSSVKSEVETRKGETTVAEVLAQKIRVLCWILTCPENHELKAKHVKETWGQRCNILLFMSTREDNDLNTVVIDIEEGRDFTWGKTKKAFEYVYNHYLHSADWFLKTDDDTFVVVENLRYMLQSHSTDEPIYFGRTVMNNMKQAYMDGGAGYVLSREALKRFVEKGLTDPEICSASSKGYEDREMGICLHNVGVLAGDSRDSLGRGRFFPFQPHRHLSPNLMKEVDWYWEHANISYAEREKDCCSDTAISFHYLHSEDLYVLNYLIYQLHLVTSEAK